MIDDITDREHIEDALDLSKKRLIEIQAIAQLGHYVFDIKADAWTCSAEIDKIFGFDDDFIRNIAGWLRAVHPDDQEMMWSYLQNDVIAQHNKLDKEYRIINFITGQEKWVHGLGYLRLDSNNEPYELFGTIQDITDRKITEDQLQLQINRLETLRSSLEMLNATQSIDIAYDVAVQSVIKVVGCDRASILLFGEDGKVHFTAWHGISDAYRTSVDGHCPWQQHEVNAEPISIPNVELADLPDDLKSIILGEGIQAAAFFPLPFNDHLLGKYMAYYNQPHEFSTDEITLGKILANDLVAVLTRLDGVEKLNLSARRLALAMEGANDGLWDWNIQTGDVYFSPRWETMLGYDVGEVEPNMSSWEKIVHPDDMDEVMAVLTEHLEGRSDQYETEHRVLAKDGSWIWILDRGKVVEWDADGNPLRAVGTHTDITEKKNAIAEKEEMRYQIEHTQRLESLGVLAGGIAHDFNNILTAIMGNAALAEQEVIRNPRGAKDYLSNIVKSSEKAALLCKQMLAYSGKGQFIIKPLDLSLMVNSITSLLKVSIKREVAINYQFKEPLSLIEADESQIQQIIMNLVINASDAIDGNGEISLSTGVMYIDAAYFSHTEGAVDLPSGKYVFLEVSDTGCGMSEDVMAKLYEPFFTTKFTGRGLGMSAVLGIMRGHHGAINVDSELGKGTTFKLLFPASDQSAEIDLDNQLSSNNVETSGVVLIIDDEEAIRDIAGMMLENMGYKTLTAIDGCDGVDVYRQHQNEIVMVLLDMTMPNLDGLGCFNELKFINRDVKVVLSSGYNEADAVSHFSGKGLSGFIQKPYKPDDLKEVMRKILTVVVK